MKKFFIFAGLIVCGLFAPSAKSQVFDTACTLPNIPYRPLTTQSPTTQNFQANACINPATGVITFQGAASSPKGSTDTGASTIFLLDPKYNFPGIAQWVCDAGISNTSNIVTTPATDRPFIGNTVRNAAVGDIVWAASADCNGSGNKNPSVTLIAQGTITSVDSAHQIHTSNSASATCTVAASDGCVLVWGPDATAAVNAAWQDAAAACGVLRLNTSGGIILQVHPTATTNCPSAVSGNDQGSGLGVVGDGPYTTMLIFSPTTTFNGVLGAFAATYSVGGNAVRRNFHDFGVASWTPAPAAASGKIGFAMTGFQNEFYNVWMLAYFPSTSQNFTALSCGSVSNAITNCHDNIIQESGQTAVSIGGDGVNFYHNQIQNNNLCVSINGAGFTTRMHDNVTALCGTNGALTVAGGGQTIYSERDAWSANGTTLPAINMSSSGPVLILRDTIVSSSQTSGPSIGIVAGATVIIEGEKSTVTSTQGTANGINNAGTLILQNTTVSVGGSGVGVNNSGVFTNKDGNTLSNGVTNTGSINGQPQQGIYQGACTGVVTSATTVGLYDLGQNTTTTCATAVIGSGKVMSKPGSVYALYCTATAGNQAQSACTVVKNGVAQTMTCSLNAVATCTDGTVAHVVTFVQGDILSISATAGVADTLANVKGTLVTN